MNVTPSIMSIRELIDAAFGDPKGNVVNHKLIQTVLVILARQLRLLERRVEVEIGPSYLESSGTSLSITEVKLHANVPRKKKGKLEGTTSTIKGARIAENGAASVDTSRKVALKPSTVLSKLGNEKSFSSAQDKSSTDKSSSVVTSMATKSSTEPSSSLKTSTAISSSDKTKASNFTETSNDRTTTSTFGKSTIEKNSTSDKTTTDISWSDKSTTEKSSSDKTTTEITSLTDKSSSDKPAKDGSSATKPSSEKSTTDKTRTQRANSREEQGNSPTPMASLDSIEKQYEKLLIVERVPSSGAVGEGQLQSGPQGKTPRLSIVTQNEFGELAALVRQLLAKFTTVGTAKFPENAQLMDDLRKGASLTDAMAALQLSARVEAAEKALEKMLSMVTELAKNTPGIDIESMLTKVQEEDAETKVIFPSAITQTEEGKKRSPKETVSKSRKSVLTKGASKESFGTSMISKLPSEVEIEKVPAAISTVAAVTTEEPKAQEPKDCVTYEELDNALQEIYDELLKTVVTSTGRSNANANTALAIANRLEGRIDEALNLGDRMFDLEKLVSDYSEQINTLDTGLSSQMTNYQEQLTQMQHDLESGLETMAEALANTGGDTAAVAELNNNFTALQNDIDTATLRQKDLRDMQDALSFDLESLWKQIEILRDTKSDRDEVTDALRDKAGLAALNGLVSREEFDAVRGDFEKRIGSAYDKFNNQEVVWQKAIDDLLRELNEKADWIQLSSLQDSIIKYLEKFKQKIQDMEEIVGEPRAAAVSRKLHRDADCLCCSSPAHMDLEAVSGPPALPGFGTSRPSAIGAEAESKPGGDGDHRVCCPGMPVPHVSDPRAHVCHRYCGGSHTILNNTVTRVPPGMIITPAVREVSTAMGTDGKLYMVDKERVRKPCLPCNVKMPTTPEPLEPEKAAQADFPSDMTPPDFRQSMQVMGGQDDVSITPPPPMDRD